MFGFLWDLHQQDSINEVRATTDQVHRDAAYLKGELTDVERRLARLELICAAMHGLIQERSGITDAEIAERVRDLDLRDGKLDGKLRTTSECGTCGRAISTHCGWCLYCGRKPK